MQKVSFDFDDTLDIDVVGDYAKELIERGVEVWVTTSRMDNIRGNPNWNDDLFSRVFECKIPITNIHFTNEEWKAKYMARVGTDFIWHLDNDWQEIDNIKAANLSVVGITNFGNEDWRAQCEELLTND